MHLDHGGNVGKFLKSTIVLQRDEILNAMWPDEPFTGPFIPADVAVLRAGRQRQTERVQHAGPEWGHGSVP